MHHIHNDLALLFHDLSSSVIRVDEVFGDPRDLLWSIFHFETYKPEGNDVVGQGIDILGKIFDINLGSLRRALVGGKSKVSRCSTMSQRSMCRLRRRHTYRTVALVTNVLKVAES